MADYGRVSNTLAEALITVPDGDAVGRVSSVLVEAAITVPAADAVGRVSSVIAEAAITDGVDLVRASYVFVEVFFQSPSSVTQQRKALGGGVQGGRMNTLRRRRR